MIRSAILLAGGNSRRMGKDKSLLPFGAEHLAERIYRKLAAVFPEVVVVTNRPEDFPVAGARMVGDRYPNRGPLEGLASALEALQGEGALLAACDMPFLSPELLAYLSAQELDADAVVPMSPRGPEPFLALYSRRLLPTAREILDRGERRMASLLSAVAVREIPCEVLGGHDPGARSFWNINRPEDYQAALAVWEAEA